MQGATLDLVGASSFMWRQQHVAGHHVWTNVHDKDPDIRVSEADVRRVTPFQPVHPHQVCDHAACSAQRASVEVLVLSTAKRVASVWRRLSHRSNAAGRPHVWNTCAAAVQLITKASDPGTLTHAVSSGRLSLMRRVLMSPCLLAGMATHLSGRAVRAAGPEERAGGRLCGFGGGRDRLGAAAAADARRAGGVLGRQGGFRGAVRGAAGGVQHPLLGPAGRGLAVVRAGCRLDAGIPVPGGVPACNVLESSPSPATCGADNCCILSTQLLGM
jgi:hypothetical protein